LETVVVAQQSHLSISDELLNFFLEESSTTGAGGDEQHRQRATGLPAVLVILAAVFDRAFIVGVPANATAGLGTEPLAVLFALLRLTSLQQFQQQSHLSISDELLNFFLEESSTTVLEVRVGDCCCGGGGRE
jgi:hypothetical protein